VETATKLECLAVASWSDNFSDTPLKLFLCPACQLPTIAIGAFERERSVCRICKSTARERAVAQALRKATKLRPNAERIIGVSDGQWMVKFATKLLGGRYANHHYHQEPLLDIVNPDPSLFNSADIVSCCEVLEHIEPPANRAFTGLFNILKLGGIAVLSVPHTRSGDAHVEHFPEMRDTKLEMEPTPRWTGYTPDGEFHSYGDLIFHGGLGSTLEFRMYSEDSFRSLLEGAGFKILDIIPNDRLHGIVWGPWSRVWLAQKPD
jgi:SAM-dependent methyltransferase